MTDLKKLVMDLMQNGNVGKLSGEQSQIIRNLYREDDSYIPESKPSHSIHIDHVEKSHVEDTEEFVEESLSLEDKEKELIAKALDKHKGKRKYAAMELGISERTLYRKIKEYDING